MTKNFNPNITQSARELLGTKESDSISNDIHPVISPTIVLMEDMNYFRTDNASYTLPSDKDFYLCYYSLDCSNDGVNSGDNVIVMTAENGDTFQISNTLNEATQKAINTHEFIRPVRLRRGSSVAITASAAGFRFSIGGFFRETKP